MTDDQPTQPVALPSESSIVSPLSVLPVDDRTRISQLAKLCQRWAELFERQAQSDTPSLCLYYQGAADALRMTAQRARDLGNSSPKPKLPVARSILRQLMETTANMLAEAE